MNNAQEEKISFSPASGSKNPSLDQLSGDFGYGGVYHLQDQYLRLHALQSSIIISTWDSMLGCSQLGAYSKAQ